MMQINSSKRIPGNYKVTHHVHERKLFSLRNEDLKGN